jgi:formate dehydrogenase maturation protein FdhE
LSAIAERVGTHGERRRRAVELAERYDFAREPLTLYGAIVEAQERVFESARSDRPTVDALTAYVVRVALPEVMGSVVTAGTETLRGAVLLRFHEGDLERMVQAWLRGEAQNGTDAFLARAATTPVLEALPEVARALPVAGEERFCPACGGPPQVSVFVDSGEALVTGQRRLVCARCANEWVYPRLTCVACGETESNKLVVLADPEQLPHLRIDACEKCKRYIVSVDARLEGRAVPVVDEIAALPLDIAAAERGFTKVTPNLMGF